MKTFSIEWHEEVNNNCYTEIEAESKEDALKKWENGEFKNVDRDERNNSYEKPCMGDIKEISKV